jgi:hypothetical protein
MAVRRNARKRSAMIAAAVVSLGMLAPVATALADTDEFINYLKRQGEDSSTAEIRMAEVNLGLAICNPYATSLDNRQVTRTMMADGHDTHWIAVWTVGSVEHLCPQYEYLLP